MAKVTKGKLKFKTHKGAAKRFKITGSGKVMRHHSFARHILTSKASKRKRRLGKAVELDSTNVGQVLRMLPYGN